MFKGLRLRKSKNLGKGTRVNYSKSGASVTKKAGPISINSRGRVTLRIAKGISFSKKFW